MMLSQEQIQFILDNENLILASSANDMPRAIIVIPSVVDSNEIVISNIQMEVSNQSIKNNPNVFLVSYSKDFNKWMKIVGKAEVLSDGKQFDDVKTLEATRCPMPVKEIIVVKIQSVVLGEE